MNENNQYRWIKFLTLLITVNFFLVFPWLYHQQQTINENLKQEVSSLNEKINQITPAIKEEIKEASDDARKAMLQSEQETINIQRYRTSVASIAPIKLMFAEAFVSEGRFPDSLDKIGIENLQNYSTGAIKILSVDPKIPRISVQLQTVSGESSGHYYLDGIGNLQTGMVQWKCKTFVDPLLQRAMPECEFSPE